MRSLFFLTEDEYQKLNPPLVRGLVRTDGLYLRALQDEKWLPVGYIPRPTTRLGWFVYHVVHGLAMRYRLLPVLVYAFRNSFLETEAGHDE